MEWSPVELATNLGYRSAAQRVTVIIEFMWYDMAGHPEFKLFDIITRPGVLDESIIPSMIAELTPALMNSEEYARLILSSIVRTNEVETKLLQLRAAHRGTLEYDAFPDTLLPMLAEVLRVEPPPLTDLQLMRDPPPYRNLAHGLAVLRHTNIAIYAVGHIVCVAGLADATGLVHHLINPEEYDLVQDLLDGYTNPTWDTVVLDASQPNRLRTGQYVMIGYPIRETYFHGVDSDDEAPDSD